MAKKTYLSSASRTDGAFAPVNVLEIGDPSQPTELILHNGKLYVYDADGQTTIDGGIVQAIGIAASAISASKLAIGQRAYVTTVSFTPSHRNRVIWTAGTIYFTGGEERDIEAGNTGYLSEKVYVYYDGTEYLRVTPDITVATAGNRAVLAVVNPAGKETEYALITDFRGEGTTISGNKITTGYISANRIAADSIAASKLSIGQKAFIHSIVFTAASYHSATWSSGVIYFADGSSANIVAGNTGSISGTHYIYYNRTQNLQLTTDIEIASQDDNIPILIITTVSEGEGKVLMTPFRAAGTTISGDQITTGVISSPDGKTKFDLIKQRLSYNDDLHLRMFFGKDDSGNYKWKVSQAGYNALTTTSDKLIASSDFNMLKIVASGTKQVVVDWPSHAGPDIYWDLSAGSITHNLGYKPACLVYFIHSNLIPFHIIDTSTEYNEGNFGLFNFLSFYTLVTTNILEILIRRDYWVKTGYTVPAESTTYTFKYFLFRETQL